MMWGWDSGSSFPWFGMFFGPVFMIIFTVIAVLIVVFLVRAFMGPGWQDRPPMRESRTALDLLKERFARGEIDRAEYEERRKIVSET